MSGTESCTLPYYIADKLGLSQILKWKNMEPLINQSKAKMFHQDNCFRLFYKKQAIQMLVLIGVHDLKGAEVA